MGRCSVITMVFHERNGVVDFNFTLQLTDYLNFDLLYVNRLVKLQIRKDASSVHFLRRKSANANIHKLLRFWSPDNMNTYGLYRT